MSPEYTGRLHAALGTLGVTVETPEQRKGGWLTGLENICLDLREGPKQEQTIRIFRAAAAEQAKCEQFDDLERAGLEELVRTLDDGLDDLQARGEIRLDGDDLDLGLMCVLYSIQDFWCGDPLPPGVTITELLLCAATGQLLALQADPDNSPPQVQA